MLRGSARSTKILSGALSADHRILTMASFSDRRWTPIILKMPSGRPALICLVSTLQGSNGVQRDKMMVAMTSTLVTTFGENQIL